MAKVKLNWVFHIMFSQNFMTRSFDPLLAMELLFGDINPFRVFRMFITGQ